MVVQYSCKIFFLEVNTTKHYFYSLLNFKWSRLSNQIFGVLLIINGLLILLELPFTLSFLYTGFIYNTKICPAWILINYSLFILSIILTAWTSIERYLFIYHEQIITSHRIVLHYFPIAFFTVYTPSFYTGAVIFYPCQQAFSVYNYLCGGPCYLFSIAPCMTDWTINVGLVLLTTGILNITLIVVNIRQRYRMRGAIITVGKRHQWVSRIYI